MNDTNNVMNTWLKTYYNIDDSNIIRIKSYNPILIPLSFDEFILWLIKRKPSFVFKFQTYGYDIRINVKDDKLYFQIDINSADGEAYNYSRGIKLKKLITYRGNDEDFIRRAKKIKFSFYLSETFEGYYLSEYQIFEDIGKRFDPNLKGKYRVESQDYKILLAHKESVVILRKKLEEIPSLLSLKSNISKINITADLPENMETPDKNLINVGMTIEELSKIDRKTLLIHEKRKELKIKKILDNYIDLKTYVINIISVIFEYNIKENITFIDLKIKTELIKPEDYYSGIGYYKTAFKNICEEKKFNFKSAKIMANELNIVINNLSDEDMCKKLEKTIYKLTLDDFKD